MNENEIALAKMCGEMNDLKQDLKQAREEIEVLKAKLEKQTEHLSVQTKAHFELYYKYAPHKHKGDAESSAESQMNYFDNVLSTITIDSIKRGENG